MWVNVVGSCAVKALLLVEKFVSVSISDACCIVVPLHCYKKRSRKQIDNWHVCTDLTGFDTFYLTPMQHTLISCKSWRGKLEIWRPLAELARLGPIPVLVFFLFFLRLCLRRSWSFFLCFLFVKKQTRLWSSPDYNWTTCLRGKFQM